MPISLPRISIVTPSYNQAQYIEQTLDSILSQGYPNLEYIVIDGGSTDGSAEIIKRYEKHLKFWVSEKDRGQTHAINKGMAHATGEVRAYLNSDDYYLPGTFDAVSEAWQAQPDTDLLHGRCRYVDETGHKIGGQFGDIQSLEEALDVWGVWWSKRQFVQPEVFWSARIAERVGPFRESLNLVMDFEYWLRIIAAGGKVVPLDRELTCYRFTPYQKSRVNSGTATEILQVIKPWLWSARTPIRWSLRLRLQGRWLYDARFRPAVEQSLEREENKSVRWSRLVTLLLCYPQLLLEPSLSRRLKTSVKNDNLTLTHDTTD